ncbi:PREDICTED: uncharacterized protein LOC109194124 isoform X3 [Ipomoea nil]|uniref:uncharacterized protein LOC109194124 isoform X3 n=1 Tax=Ipomoea nil TaxID=35883 RepID=UPI0009016243|nr:PREDICTED: uncharacterized protein LOC109194124 isoform X3 [Ipomoea nil]
MSSYRSNLACFSPSPSVFTQTRIWLGEVLNMRLNEQSHISDLLADGDLLFEVSKVVWNMLFAKCPELRRLKYKPLDSRKSSGRYRPYSNVDSFLKICKILGLNGIDLFSPSDVVEKRNVRKVCICLRALSKKARSKHLKVPDFDVVTYTVAMPKDMVGGIRRSLETSQCSFSSSSSYSSYKDQRQKVRQKNLTEAGDKNYDSCSEESDEAESKYMGEESYCSSTNNNKYTAPLNSDCENSPGVCSAVTKSSMKQSLLHSDMRDQHIYDNGFNQFGSESTKYPSSQHARNYESQDGVSSSCIKSQRKLHQSDDLSRPLDNDIMHFDHVDPNMGNCASVQDSIYDYEAEGDYISDYLAFSDSVIGGADGNSPVLLEGEDNIFNFFMGVDSHWSRSSRCSVDGCGNKFSDDIEDLEVSSTASMSSLLGRALNLEFDDHFDIDAHNALLDNEGCSQDRGLLKTPQARDVADDGNGSQCHDEFKSASKECLRDPPGALFLTGNNKSEDDNNADPGTEFGINHRLHNSYSGELKDGCVSSLQSQQIVSFQNEHKPSAIRLLDESSVNQNLVAHPNSYEALEEKHPYIPVKDSNEFDTKHRDMDFLAENVSNGKDKTNVEASKDKVHRRPFLHTVAKGTAIFGMMFLVLHLSRRDREKDSDANKKPPQTKKFKGRDISYREGQNGGRDRIYPAEKLKFKN